MNKQIELLYNLADKLKYRKRSREEIITTLKLANIINEDETFAKQYSLLGMYIKNEQLK